MMYARILAGGVERLVDLAPEEYAALQANGKAAVLRLWIVDPQPTVTATQVVAPGPIVISATEAHQTWTVRDKTQAELDRDANTTEQAQIKAAITELTTDIQAYNANPDTSGTQALQLANLWAAVKDMQRQQRRNNRILRYYLRGLT